MSAALETANKARAVFTSLGESWRVARVNINAANVYHRQNRYAEALEAYEGAYRQLVPYRDMEGVGVALHNMAVCLIALDDFKGAMETYRRVRAFCQEHEMPLLVAQADYNIAFLYYLRGEYSRALTLLRATREACHENGDAYHSALCDLDQSEIYLELSLIQEAGEMAQAAYSQFEQLNMGFETARSLTNMAIAASFGREPKQALELFGRAKAIASKENNQAWSNTIDLYRSVLFLEHGQTAQALEACSAAADFFRSIHMPSRHVSCLLTLAKIHLRTGEIDRGVQCCREALTILEDLDSPILFYEAQFVLGQAYEATGQQQLAYDSYQLSRSALETLRSSLQRQELKIGFLRNRVEVYSRLVQLCLNRGSEDAAAAEALSYVEAAKSRTLRDLILAEPQTIRSDSEETRAGRQMSSLRRELNWFYHRIEIEQLSPDGPAPGSVQELERQARQREQELSRYLLEEPESASVDSALVHSTGATLDEIRRALGAKAALLEYFNTGETLSVAVVTADALRIVPLGPLSNIARSVCMLQFQLDKPRLGANYLERFGTTLLRHTQAHLKSLYDVLIAPVENLLSLEDLVIVPSGLLHTLPFHALFNGQLYLADRFNICYQPSASIFVKTSRMPLQGGRTSLILGVADAKTPFVEEEVKAIAEVMPEARLLFGSSATEEALREYGPRSSFIHIASHGKFRQDSPMFSSIKLATSYLTLYDLYHMNLPVHLLTLSGCVTGLNTVVEGDELLGLTRGLLYAGARSLLLSLWEVDDRSTSEFMKEFYTSLGRQPRKADALRSAMLALKKRHSHPYHWAPFKLIGEAF